jgi:hypothetical protein
MSKWQKRATRLIARLSGNHHSLKQFADANLAAVAGALEGKGPDAAQPDPRAGVRAVVNIPSVHVPSFCERSKKGQEPAYRNSYDLDHSKVRLGDPPPHGHWKTREIVDNALAHLHGHAMDKVYFAAAELNGAGIRFYGDICLVLAPDHLLEATKVLDRNSYDIMRAPFRLAVDHLPEHRRQAARRWILSSLSGTGRDDLKTMGAVKVLVTTGERDRRFSTGQISGGVLDDEDYMEILRIGSFTTKNLEAARLSAAEVALESHVEQRLQAKPTASHVSHEWLRDRRNATRALEEQGVEISVVASPGRIKS